MMMMTKILFTIVVAILIIIPAIVLITLLLTWMDTWLPAIHLSLRLTPPSKSHPSVCMHGLTPARVDRWLPDILLGPLEEPEEGVMAELLQGSLRDPVLKYLAGLVESKACPARRRAQALSCISPALTDPDARASLIRSQVRLCSSYGHVRIRKCLHTTNVTIVRTYVITDILTDLCIHGSAGRPVADVCALAKLCKCSSCGLVHSQALQWPSEVRTGELTDLRML